MSTPQVAALLREGAAKLPGEDARHEAEQLLLHVLGVDRAWLFAHATEPVDDDARQRFELLLQRRAEGHPLAYLTGRRGFWTLDLQVNVATLIPRPETELLVEQALARLPPDHMARVARFVHDIMWAVAQRKDRPAINGNDPRYPSCAR